MKIINQSHKILYKTDPILIEKAGRVAYKSEDKMGTDTKGFIRRLISRGHESVLEHSMMTVQFITDRGVTHELVRHRLGSYTQESTRYCNYSLGKFGNEITVVRPWWAKDIEADGDDLYGRWYNWMSSVRNAEAGYMNAINYGQTPQEARDLLPTCTKAEIIVSTNYREWRHILKLRTAKDAHPQMQDLMRPLLDDLKTDHQLHMIFEDIDY